MTYRTDSTFGERVHRMRTLRGLTQAEVSERVGTLSRSSIANIESGRQEPTLGHLKALASALDATVGALLGEVPIPEVPDVSIVTSHHVVCAECGTVADDVTADDARGFRQRHVDAHLQGARP